MTAGFVVRLLWLMALLVPLAGVCADTDNGTGTTTYVYLGKAYDEPPPLSLLEPKRPDEGLAGARLSNRDNNLTGRMIGHEFQLVEEKVGEDEDVVAKARELLSAGQRLFVADLEADDLLAVSALPKASDAIFLNVRAGDNRLRVSDCRANIFHMVPSRAMRTDAIAQYLIWKRWRRWFLVRGKKPADIAYADAARRSAKRFGGEIVETRAYQLETGSRRSETGYQQIQTQMPEFTRGAPDHDVVFVADEKASFGLYLPYRTVEPRPVVGTYGLVATAWHRSYEQYGGMSLQHNFERFGHRDMTERDYLAWLAVKLFGKATVRGTSDAPGDVRAFLLTTDLNLAGYKGRPMNFRRWNQQLRQPVLLSSAEALVSVAPLDGFLHPRYYTDTLGFDAPDSDCHLNPPE